MLDIDTREFKTVNPEQVRPCNTVLNHYDFYTADTAYNSTDEDPVSWSIYHLTDNLSWQLLGRALHSFPFSAERELFCFGNP